MTTLSGYTKGTITSESQAALNNFKKGTRRDTSAYPILKNGLYYDTLQRSFLATIKSQGVYDAADPDFDPYDGDQYDQQQFEEKQCFVYSVFITSLQKQKFGILHTSGCLMVDVPCLDYLRDGQKDCPGDKQIIWGMREIPRNMPLCMILGLLWQSCHAWITYMSICMVVLVMMTDHATCGAISLMSNQGVHGKQTCVTNI